MYHFNIWNILNMSIFIICSYVSIFTHRISWYLDRIKQKPLSIDLKGTFYLIYSCTRGQYIIFGFIRAAYIFQSVALLIPKLEELPHNHLAITLLRWLDTDFTIHSSQ